MYGWQAPRQHWVYRTLRIDELLTSAFEGLIDLEVEKAQPVCFYPLKQLRCAGERKKERKKKYESSDTF